MFDTIETYRLDDIGLVITSKDEVVYSELIDVKNGLILDRLTFVDTEMTDVISICLQMLGWSDKTKDVICDDMIDYYKYLKIFEGK